MSKTDNKPFYQNPLTILLFLIFLPPIGVYLMWAYWDMNVALKKIFSFIFLSMFLVFVIFEVVNAYNGDEESNTIPEGAAVTKVDESWGLYKGNELVDNYSGLATNDLGTWVIKDGYVDFGYTGVYEFDGQTYNVVNGKVT